MSEARRCRFVSSTLSSIVPTALYGCSRREPSLLLQPLPLQLRLIVGCCADGAASDAGDTMSNGPCRRGSSRSRFRRAGVSARAPCALFLDTPFVPTRLCRTAVVRVGGRHSGAQSGSIDRPLFSLLSSYSINFSGSLTCYTRLRDTGGGAGAGAARCPGAAVAQGVPSRSAARQSA